MRAADSSNAISQNSESCRGRCSERGVLRVSARTKAKETVKMPTGTVKWFNDSKGFGFITPDAGGDDLFAHFSEVRGDGFKTLAENQKVSYETKRGPKGMQAANISPQ